MKLSLYFFIGNIRRTIIGSESSKALQEATTTLNEAVQFYTEAVQDMELKLSITIFKQGKDIQRTLDSLFNQMMSIEPELRMIAGPCLTEI